MYSIQRAAARGGCGSAAAAQVSGLRCCSALTGVGQGRHSNSKRLAGAACNSQTQEASTSSGAAASQPASPPSLAKVTYRGVEFQVASGTKLRTAMLTNGVTPHNGGAQQINCRGLGTCGTCAVEVLGPPNSVSPEARTAAEQLRLNFPPHGPPGNQRLRLACQVAVLGDVEVVKRCKFWGQGAEVLGPLTPAERSAGVMPLGRLELLLDGGARGAAPSESAAGSKAKADG